MPLIRFIRLNDVVRGASKPFLVNTDHVTYMKLEKHAGHYALEMRAGDNSLPLLYFAPESINDEEVEQRLEDLANVINAGRPMLDEPMWSPPKAGVNAE